MNALDRALLDFWANNDGKVPTRIYIGFNVLNEVWKTDKYYQFNMIDKMYQGIPYFIIHNDEDHLAVY